MEDKLIKKIQAREKEGTLRSLSLFTDQIDFFSNDYLGLAKEKFTIQLKESGGSTGSRLLSGNSIEAERCELKLANFFNSEAALVFNSGFDANIGFFSAVCQRDDLVFYDENVHASIRDGIQLSKSKSIKFKHNSIQDLRAKLNRFEGVKYIVIESLYSMNGTIAPIAEMVEVAKEAKAYLVIDEAHACGVFGEKGKGLTFNFSKDIFARIITFGKAYGAHGAAVLSSLLLKQYLVNFSRPFIYSTALPPASYVRIEQNVVAQKTEKRRRVLEQNVSYFRKKAKEFNSVSDEISPIQIIHFTDRQKMKEVVTLLVQNGFAIKPIYYPTVKREEEGIRICLHFFNTFDEIDDFFKFLRMNY